MAKKVEVFPQGTPRTRRRAVVLPAAVLPAAVLAACGGQGAEGQPQLPAQNQRVEWWAPATGALKPTFDNLVAAANASGRRLQVEVTPESVGITDASRAKFTAAVAAGAPPDLIFVDRYLVRSFGAVQMIGSLEGYVKGSRTFKAGDFWPYLIKDVTWKEALWGTPFSTDVRAFYWIKAAFADAGLDPEKGPATWDAVEAASDRLLKRGGDGSLTRVGFVPHWGNPPTFYSFFLYLWQSGGEFLTPDENRPAFNSAPGLQALEWMVRQVTKVGGMPALQPLTTGFEAGPGRDVFTVGRLGMQYHTSSAKATYEQNVPDVRFGIGPLAAAPLGRAADELRRGLRPEHPRGGAGARRRLAPERVPGHEGAPADLVAGARRDPGPAGRGHRRGVPGGRSGAQGLRRRAGTGRQVGADHPRHRGRAQRLRQGVHRGHQRREAAARRPQHSSNPGAGGAGPAQAVPLSIRASARHHRGGTETGDRSAGDRSTGGTARA
jgi:ABC-type glycerol-3-phosphate transport system substrate-binding protein